MKRIMICALILLLVGTTALAMPIRISNGSVTVSGRNLSDGVEGLESDDGAGETGEALDSLWLFRFQLLGYDENDDYLIYNENVYYSVPRQDLEVMALMIDPELIAGLSHVTDYEDLKKGSKGEKVAQLQEALIQAGYLEGTADGNWGGGTEQAIRAFQLDNGLIENGVADAKLQMLARSVAQPEFVYDASAGTEKLFAPIAGRVSVDMQPIYDSGLRLEYDDMTGNGFISDGTSMEFDLSGEADIERYILTLQFGLDVTEGEDGMVKIDPVVRIACACARRPVMESVIVKSGSARGQADVDAITTRLDGTDTIESCTARLTDQMVEALANAEEAGELKLRISGRYREFDVEVESQYLAGLARLGKTAAQLGANG